MKQQKQAFTLVELIVVIIMLAILGTITFISLQGYSQDARDSTRLADMKIMSKTLEIYKLRDSQYPLPENGTQITFSGAEVRTQGIFGEETRKDLSKHATISTPPKDPLTNNHYTYSVLNTRLEYQLGTILEGGAVSQNTPSIIPTTQAKKQARAYIIGDYNGVVAKVSTGTTTYVLAVPSIISTDIGEHTLLGILNNQKLVFKNYSNIPSSYQGYTSTGGFVYDPLELVLYEGSIKDLSDNGTLLQDFATKLQQAYSGTKLQTIGIYENLLTNEDLVVLAGNIVNNNLGGEVNISSFPSSYNNCTSGTIQGLDYESITYPYSDINHGETITGTGLETISNGIKNYVADIICNDGTTSISNEQESVSCDTNYIEDGGSCVLNQCSGTIPTNATSNATEQQYGTSWTYNTTPGVCTYVCNINYTWNGSSCAADTRIQSCIGKPANSTYNTATSITQTWNGISWLPTTTATYNTTASTTSCRFKCNTNYKWNSTTQKCDLDIINAILTYNYNNKSYRDFLTNLNNLRFIVADNSSYGVSGIQNVTLTTQEQTYIQGLGLTYYAIPNSPIVPSNLSVTTRLLTGLDPSKLYYFKFRPSERSHVGMFAISNKAYSNRADLRDNSYAIYYFGDWINSEGWQASWLSNRFYTNKGTKFNVVDQSHYLQGILDINRSLFIAWPANISFEDFYTKHLLTQ